ncbi:TPA: preprotein translocase subunit SecY [Candidatus Galligastranaerophilus intestinavium]|uniref:Protein translocase subunit SecY n=1 Tax=Candidatus Galligastranaerophilus intestinavium TaxID=2840836 RepID=A0A9D1JYA1_9BACT|nr:preprotein translocase subunit SecY [Candidatus Galligastranaerophilus intestinavium]
MQQQVNSQQMLESLMSNLRASGLKQKLIFTFAIIALFRFGAQLPIYGINNEVFQAMAAGNNMIGFLDLFSGGALGKVSIFALGIGPYITASIIMQLLAVIIPYLEKLQKEEGEAGRRKIQQLTRQFTVVLALFQSFVFVTILTKLPNSIVHTVSTPLFFIGSMAALTAGSVFVMWLAELITEKGVGNGGSLIIFIGIISGIPLYASRTATLVSQDTALQLGLVGLLAIFVATIIFIIVFQDAVRKVPIVSARRQVGNKVYGGANTNIPFKLNPGGVMPIIFAVAILLFPATILSFVQQMKLPEGVVRNVLEQMSLFLSPSSVSYYVIYFLLIVALTFFYASIIPSMQPKEIANNLKKYGSAIPGVKPGKPTADKLDEILSRTIFIGAISLGIIALIPTIASKITNITTMQGLGATSLIIMVGVALDFINQIKTHMLAKNYESFLQQ